MDDTSSARVDYQAIADELRSMSSEPRNDMPVADYYTALAIWQTAQAFENVGKRGRTVPMPSDTDELWIQAHVVAGTFVDLEDTHSPYVGMIGYVLPTGRHYVYATCNGETKWWRFGDKENVMVSRVRTFGNKDQ